MANQQIRNLILTGIAVDVDSYQSEEFASFAFGTRNTNQRQFRVRKYLDALEGMVPYKPSEWAGRQLTGTERRHFHDVLRELREDGLVMCYTDVRGRTTHVALTEEGWEIATEVTPAVGVVED